MVLFATHLRLAADLYFCSLSSSFSTQVCVLGTTINLKIQDKEYCWFKIISFDYGQTRVDPARDVIYVNGNRLPKRLPPKVYLALNKPKGFVIALPIQSSFSNLIFELFLYLEPGELMWLVLISKISIVRLTNNLSF